MSILLAYIIAGLCAAGFVTIWFSTAYAELSQKRNNLADLEEQLRLHEGMYAQARDSSEVQTANKMMETSRMLWNEATKNYNSILHKPMNRIPALLMGFRKLDREDKQG